MLLVPAAHGARLAFEKACHFTSSLVQLHPREEVLVQIQGANHCEHLERTSSAVDFVGLGADVTKNPIQTLVDPASIQRGVAEPLDPFVLQLNK